MYLHEEIKELAPNSKPAVWHKIVRSQDEGFIHFVLGTASGESHSMTIPVGSLRDFLADNGNVLSSCSAIYDTPEALADPSKAKMFAPDF